MGVLVLILACVSIYMDEIMPIGWRPKPIFINPGFEKGSLIFL